MDHGLFLVKKPCFAWPPRLFLLIPHSERMAETKKNEFQKSQNLVFRGEMELIR